MAMRLQKADTVIYLDYNRLVCIARWIKRVVTNRGKARADMAPGCCEWFDPEFFGWLWNFNREHRKDYYALFSNRTDKRVCIFKTPRQTADFLKSL